MEFTLQTDRQRGNTKGPLREVQVPVPETDTTAGALKRAIMAHAAEVGSLPQLSEEEEVSRHKPAVGLSTFPVGVGKGIVGEGKLTPQGEEPWHLSSVREGLATSQQDACHTCGGESLLPQAVWSE